eukprot:TRINITY_DN13853_c0_g1_i1.p1 TRINITY_DN13853_c0_g1~~TRINITY_DN13853_c0_g1_i1.p1  ORF type:complete len:162 (-),score=22.76 TRINITY_DN13853_c0_g1_i1:195-680(-)
MDISQQAQSPATRALLSSLRDIEKEILNSPASSPAGSPLVRRVGQWTPTHEQALRGDVQQLAACVKASGCHSPLDPDARTPLTLAAMNGHAECVEMLLHIGSDPNHIDAMGRTALHWAAEGGHLLVTRLLLQSGVDYTVLDREGRAAAHLANADIASLCWC